MPAWMVGDDILWQARLHDEATARNRVSRRLVLLRGYGQNMNEHTGMPGYALVACTPVSLERHGLPAMCRSMCRARCRATLAMVRGQPPSRCERHRRARCRKDEHTHVVVCRSKSLSLTMGAGINSGSVPHNHGCKLLVGVILPSDSWSA